MLVPAWASRSRSPHGDHRVMLQCALQSQSDEEIARAQIGLQGPSPNGLRRRPLNPDLGARHDVVWSRAGSLSSGNPSGMRTVSSSVRRTPAAGRCELSRGACGGRTRAGRPRGAQTHHVALRRARRARCRGARDRGRVIMRWRWRAGGGGVPADQNVAASGAVGRHAERGAV